MSVQSMVPGTESPIHRLSPITKLVVVILWWTIALITFDVVILVFLILIGLLLWVIGRIDLSGFKVVLGAAGAIGVFMMVINALTFAAGETALFRLPLLGWPIWLEGVLFGAVIGLKIMAVISVVPLLTQTTPMPQFMAGLAALRVPYKVAFTLGIAFRLQPLIQQTYQDITESQKMRGHDVDEMPLRKRILEGYFPLFVPLILTMLRRSQDLDIAIESRAFGAPVERTSLVDIGLKTGDFVFLSFFAVAFAAIVWYSYFGVGLIPVEILEF